MKNMIIKTITLSSIALISSCTGRTVHMENEQGNKVDCEVPTTEAVLLTGAVGRDMIIDDCVKKEEEAGYKVTGEE